MVMIARTSGINDIQSITKPLQYAVKSRLTNDQNDEGDDNNKWYMGSIVVVVVNDLAFNSLVMSYQRNEKKPEVKLL